MDDEHAEVVATASALLLAELLPVLFRLTPAEQVDRLCQCFRSAIADYCNGARGWFIPDPSVN